MVIEHEVIDDWNREVRILRQPAFSQQGIQRIGAPLIHPRRISDVRERLLLFAQRLGAVREYAHLTWPAPPICDRSSARNLTATVGNFCLAAWAIVGCSKPRNGATCRHLLTDVHPRTVALPLRAR
jgi:hypothetical protein